MLAQFVSPKAVDAAVAGLSLTLCALLLRGIDVATEAVGLHPLPVFAVPILPSSLLFFAGPTPPPARGFLLCTIFAWAAALGINYVDFHDDFDEPTAAALVVGVLLALFKATNNFFVPTVGLVAALVVDPTRGLEDPVAALQASSRRRGSPATRSCTPSRTARRAAGGGCARRSRSRASRPSSPPPPTPATTRCAPRSRASTRAGDGFLQPGELKYAWKAATGEVMSDDDADAMVRSIDADGNGEIDVDEFIALVRDHVCCEWRERLLLRRRRAAFPLVGEPFVEPAIPRAEEALCGARDRAPCAARVGVERS